jgi:hypothetical protein
MSSSENYNKHVLANGGSILQMDEDLRLKYEQRKERVYWASVYGSEYRKVPKGFFHTTQNVYRDFCVAVGGMMPKKRQSVEFDQYLRERLAEATVMETLPGMEEGAIVRHAIFSVISRVHAKSCDYDDLERKVPHVSRGDPVFFETRKEGPGFKEIFVRINWLMEGMTHLQSLAQFERRINREEVVDCLMAIGRDPYPATGVSPRRLRSTYPIPYSLWLSWRRDDESGKIDAEEEHSGEERKIRDLEEGRMEELRKLADVPGSVG